ncbi:hypothetical protein [Rhizobium leguminosarum]|uniref:hypothetical protein n=1 Tax=Rhizobium leguminosarum TaxID=384 RepID=UPI001011F695|nr:hypothetical protein [Rhizobium leguminosarum]
MFHSLRQISARPQLLLLAFMIFVQGSAYGSTLPYLSITAIRGLGMSDQAYSVLVFVTSVSAVTISVSLGILSDLIGDRRRIMIAMALSSSSPRCRCSSSLRRSSSRSFSPSARWSSWAFERKQPAFPAATPQRSTPPSGLSCRPHGWSCRA